MTDPFNLQRFIDAQDGVYEMALAELCAGQKQSHWMWFIFPQLRGLGLSPTSLRYGIASLEESKAYLDHPLLGGRLCDCVQALLRWEGRPPEQILGSVDALKLRSSMTLFDQVDPGALFAKVLEGFYRGERDLRTLALLNAER